MSLEKLEKRHFVKKKRNKYIFSPCVNATCDGRPSASLPLYISGKGGGCRHYRWVMMTIVWWEDKEFVGNLKRINASVMIIDVTLNMHSCDVIIDSSH